MLDQTESLPEDLLGGPPGGLPDLSEDWITQSLAHTAGAPSPEIFRLWAAIGAVAGALERRVFASTAQGPIYPNLFILLVAPPAIGKSIAISPIGGIWRETQKIHVAPDSLTKASLVDSLAKADRKIITPAGLVEYHSLACCVPELGVLMPAHDLEIMSTMTRLYDNEPSYSEERRTLNRSIDISRPQINILAGTQPGFLASFLPEVAWAQGFMARFIMIYSGVSPKIDLFDERPIREADRKVLVKRMSAWCELVGEALFTSGAKAALRLWHDAGCLPVPEHSKLEHYNGRRIMHVIKLSLISAISRTSTLVIDTCDVDRAKGWLLRAEGTMPDIFRQMVGKSDNQTIQELHFFLFREYSKNKKPLHEAVVYDFLRQHAPSDKIEKIIQIAERSNVIVRMAGSPAFYTPKPKSSHGVE